VCEQDSALSFFFICTVSKAKSGIFIFSFGLCGCARLQSLSLALTNSLFWCTKGEAITAAERSEP
jgi:hypothetical protein